MPTTEVNMLGESPIISDGLRLCRGCASTGLAITVSLRAARIAALPIRVPLWIDPVTGRHRQRVIPGVGQLAPVNSYLCRPRVTDKRWSLTDVLVTYAHLTGIGATPERALNVSWADRCPRCDGHG